MKNLVSVLKTSFASLVLLLAVHHVQASQGARVVEFHTEKVGEVMHWMPEKIEVHPGETIKFVIKHELQGGFDFHGFAIRELNILKQIDRNKTVEIEKTIPADLKVGEYKVGCQFHPKHAGSAVLVVKAAETPVLEAPKK